MAKRRWIIGVVVVAGFALWPRETAIAMVSRSIFVQENPDSFYSILQRGSELSLVRYVAGADSAFKVAEETRVTGILDKGADSLLVESAQFSPDGSYLAIHLDGQIRGVELDFISRVIVVVKPADGTVKFKRVLKGLLGSSWFRWMNDRQLHFIESMPRSSSAVAKDPGVLAQVNVDNWSIKLRNAPRQELLRFMTPSARELRLREEWATYFKTNLRPSYRPAFSEGVGEFSGDNLAGDSLGAVSSSGDMAVTVCIRRSDGMPVLILSKRGQPLSRVLLDNLRSRSISNIRIWRKYVVLRLDKQGEEPTFEVLHVDGKGVPLRISGNVFVERVGDQSRKPPTAKSAIDSG